MAAATNLEIEVRAIKWAITTRILMKFDTQTKKSILSSKVTKAEATDRFQDGRRHVGNSSACYKMGNYHRTVMKIGTQNKTDMLSSKVIKAEACGKKNSKN
jgi:hypothetical protein